MAGSDAIALRGASRLTLAVSEYYFIVEESATWQVQRAAQERLTAAIVSGRRPQRSLVPNRRAAAWLPAR